MRNNERFSDLRFICNDKTIVKAHSEIFRQASPFMAALLKIAKEKQVWFIYSLDFVDIRNQEVETKSIKVIL